jgi:autotransporter-associated beta strand protein
MGEASRAGITGTGSINLAGGTLALSGSNTYAGGTTASAGQLNVANPGALAGGSLSLSSSAIATLSAGLGQAVVLSSLNLSGQAR